MGTLHLLQVSPHQGDAWTSCLRTLGEGDSVVLMGDGIYAACLPQPLPDEIPCYLLQADLQARGLHERIQASAIAIDYDALVTLTEHYERIQSWY